MKVHWSVCDGFVNNGTQTTTIDDGELAECETEAEREQLIADAIQEDFAQKISWRREKV